MFRFLFLSACAISAFAQSASLNAQLGRTVQYRNVSISPDGKHAAWSQSLASERNGKIHIDAAALRISGDTGRSDTDPAWSPDSSSLSFFSTAGEKEGQAQLWIVSANGKQAKKRTQLKGYAAHPRWSHNGRFIAFFQIEGGEGGGPLLAAPAQTGVIDEVIRNQRIAMLEVSTGQVKFASPPDLHVYDFDWSPDDKTFVCTAAPGPGDNNWWIASVYTIDVATTQAKAVYKTALQLAIPRWSPDGRSIAFIEGIMSDEGSHGGDLLIIPAAGGTARNLTKDRKSSPNSFFWNSNDRITVLEWAGGGTQIATLNPSTGEMRPMWRGDENLHAFGGAPNFDLSSDGKVSAAVRDSFTTAPEVWTGPIGEWRKLTAGNAVQEPHWGQAKSIEWNSDQFHVQGWLLPPKRIEPGRRYPMIVMVHGGPSSSVQPSWPTRFSLSVQLAARGYYVFLPNPRGSYGQGEAFTQANVKDFGGGDLRDVMAGVDEVLAKFPVDPQRLGVTGWSYGGYMTMWTVTQTNRFKAAMAGAGIANWQSYYGQNLIDKWMLPFFGASVYDDPAVYEKSSPIHFIKNVKTPTLVIVGERDAECPAPQSFEFWHALRTLGTPTELIVYAGEGHMFMQQKNRDDMLDRTLAWFDKYLR